MLRLAHENRLDRWKKFQRYISSRARARFGALLAERSFRGTLKTDHVERVLELKVCCLQSSRPNILQVEPDETRAAAKGRQAQTLSGGEKSFSTICLLLALWDAMGSPIRCLDELYEHRCCKQSANSTSDVFMDSVNRDVTLKMIVSLHPHDHKYANT
jgi:hypothetical protein